MQNLRESGAESLKYTVVKSSIILQLMFICGVNAALDFFPFTLFNLWFSVRITAPA